MSEEIKRYSKKRKSFQFEVEEDDGKVALYTMVELLGDERDKWLTSQIKRGTDQKGGSKRPEVQGACSDLLTLCVRDPQNQIVPAAEIDKWPSDMQLELFDQAKKLSGLDRGEAEKDAKNV